MAFEGAAQAESGTELSAAPVGSKRPREDDLLPVLCSCKLRRNGTAKCFFVVANRPQAKKTRGQETLVKCMRPFCTIKSAEEAASLKDSNASLTADGKGCVYRGLA
jgi:hypothetical protein